MDELTAQFEQMNSTNLDQQKQIKLAVDQLHEKIETIEEKYFLGGEMSRESISQILPNLSKQLPICPKDSRISI